MAAIDCSNWPGRYPVTRCSLSGIRFFQFELRLAVRDVDHSPGAHGRSRAASFVERFIGRRWFLREIAKSLLGQLLQARPSDLLRGGQARRMLAASKLMRRRVPVWAGHQPRTLFFEGPLDEVSAAAAAFFPAAGEAALTSSQFSLAKSS